MKPLVASDMPLAGISLIEASAGTGKTYTIATLFLRLLLESRLPIDRILVVTYTNAATAELRGRLRARVQETLALLEHPPVPAEEEWLARARITEGSRDRLRAALFGFDQAAIFTIHGFCQRALRENAFESGADFDAELVPDESSFVADAVHDAWVARLHAAEPELVRALKQDHITPESVAKLLRLVATHAEARLLPEQEEPSDAWKASATAAEESRQRAWAIWQDQQHEIVELLRSPSMNASRYRPASVLSWAGKLTRALAVAQLGIEARFDNTERFATSFIATAVKKNCTPPSHPFFDEIDTLLDNERAAASSLRHSASQVRRQLLDDAQARLAASKHDARVQSFDDLIHQLVAALRQEISGPSLAAALRQRFHAALIDEFQDTDPRQAEIFQRIFADVETRPPLVYVGDPKQAIYAFRGADVYAYLDARALAGEQVYTLTTNRRSDPSLLHAVNQLYAACDDPFAMPEIAYHAVAARPDAVDAFDPTHAAALQILTLSNDTEADATSSKRDARLDKDSARQRIAAGVAAEIAELLEDEASFRPRPDAQPRRVQPADIAVLCRTNDQARSVLHELRRLGLRAVSQGADSVFVSDAAADVERLLQALAQPRDSAALRAALATPCLGSTAEQLDALRSDSLAWEPYVTAFLRGHRQWETSGVYVALQGILDEYSVAARLLARPGGERHYTDLLHVAELLHTVESEQRLGARGLLRWLSEMRTDPAAAMALGADAALLRMESDDEAIRLVTMHKSKGLEYPVVFCPFLWDGALFFNDEKKSLVLHHPETHELTISLGETHPDGFEAQAERERRGENLRLLYVAVTRARHRCYLAWGNIRSSEDSPLAHLLGNPLASMPVELLPEALAQRADAIVVRPLRGRRDRPVALGEQSTTELQARVVTRRVHSGITLASFSSIIASGSAGGYEHAADRDASAATTVAVPAGSTGTRLALDDLAAGARTGDLIHSIFERIDFAAPAADLEGVVAEQLEQHGFSVERWRVPLASAFADWLATPLPHPFGAPTLAEIAAPARIAEMEFLLPAARSDNDEPVRIERLADAFRRHAACGAEIGWPERIARLRAGEWRGFLRGFVDLVFRHDGRWYVSDYKSNYLGAFAHEYEQSRLLGSMSEHHYFLQYHLYCVALVRHLHRRLPDFDYERDFGGVFYLFVRGMHPRHAPGTAIFYDRPSRALIEGLDACFGGGLR